MDLYLPLAGATAEALSRGMSARIVSGLTHLTSAAEVLESDEDGRKLGGHTNSFAAKSDLLQLMIDSECFVRQKPIVCDSPMTIETHVSNETFRVSEPRLNTQSLM